MAKAEVGVFCEKGHEVAVFELELTPKGELPTSLPGLPEACPRCGSPLDPPTAVLPPKPINLDSLKR